MILTVFPRHVDTGWLLQIDGVLVCIPSRQGELS